MTAIEALISGIVQGLTEFLPISSSGHLQLLYYWFGSQDLEHPILFSLVCHLGTLGAICLVLFEPICALFQADRQRLIQIIFGTLPLFPLVFLLQPIKAAFGNFQFLGFCFLLSSLVLFLGLRFGTTATTQERERKKWRDALLIGCCQAVAVLPGISRSGATISGARLLGWEPREAVCFSFLLAIPATLGGATLEAWHLFKESEVLHTLPLLNLAIGFVASFSIGYCTFQLLLHVLYRKFSFFAGYCFILGLAAAAYFHL